VSLLLSVDWDVRIAGAAVGLTRRARVLSRHGLRVERSATRIAHEADPPAAATPWAAALATLDAALAAQPETRRAPRRRARVVLPDSLVRYAVLPWQLALAGRTEEQAYLRHRFGHLYDAGTAGWHLRVEPGRGRARLASAVHPALVDALCSLLAAHDIVLGALVPALADTVNRERTRLVRPNAWLACHDAGCLCLAGWNAWQWTTARSFRVGPCWHAELPALLAREECMHDGSGVTDALYLYDCDGAAFEPVPGWHTEDLRGAQGGAGA
jgi:hypothetical protein